MSTIARREAMKALRKMGVRGPRKVRKAVAARIATGETTIDTCVAPTAEARKRGPRHRWMR